MLDVLICFLVNGHDVRSAAMGNLDMRSFCFLIHGCSLGIAARYDEEG